MAKRGIKTAVITARVPEGLRDIMLQHSAEEHRTISQQVSLILSDYVRTLQGHAGKTGSSVPIGCGAQ